MCFGFSVVVQVIQVMFFTAWNSCGLFVQSDLCVCVWNLASDSVLFSFFFDFSKCCKNVTDNDSEVEYCSVFLPGQWCF